MRHGAAMLALIAVSLAAAVAPVYAAGTGLGGAYYDSADLTALKLTRTDATVNFNWGGGSPSSLVAADTFSVRWTGAVQPLYSQTYTFYTYADDGVRLWVNGQLLVDDWTVHAPVERSGAIALVAGARYAIRLEYFDNTGGATVKLSWSSASQAKQVISQSQLYPVDTTAPTVSLTAPTGASTVSGTVNVAATAGDNVGVTRVDFLVDGAVKASDTTSPYGYAWDTKTVANGSHTLQARAYDAAGNVGSSSSVTVPVGNPIPIPCTGVQVASGADLGSVMNANVGGRTYCLAAGTFPVSSTITTEDGDRLIGAGRNATFITGNGLPPTATGIFHVASGTVNQFESLEISGAPTPTAGSGVYCTPSSNCGKAFHVGSAMLTLRSVDCHSNMGSCIGGGGNGSVTIDDLDCWNNGSAYSMTSSFRYAACVKRAAVYAEGGNFTITNSRIHDNPWTGLWCDFCKYGYFDIRNNVITHNGKSGVQWEMSGGWTTSDRALIRSNVIRDNNYSSVPQGAGVIISTANDIVVENNIFGNNRSGTGSFWGVKILHTAGRSPPQPDSRGVVVRNNIMSFDRVEGCTLAGVTCSGNG